MPARYFHTRRQHGAMGEADWSALPHDLLLKVARKTGENPLKFAGVCKAWAQLLDDPRCRALLMFAPTSATRRTLQEAARSFTTFVCKRAAQTASLDVWLPCPADAAALASVIAALTPALVHLAPRLRTLAIEPDQAADLFTAVPLMGLCTELERVRAPVNDEVDMDHLRTLRAVDLTFRGHNAGRASLPPTLTTCRLRATVSAPPHLLYWLQHGLAGLRRLEHLALHTDHHTIFAASNLASSLRSLVVRGTVYTDMSLQCASLPCLETLALQKCKMSAVALDALLLRCPRLRALELVDYFFDDIAFPVIDLDHLPLQALALVSNPYRTRLTCALPPGIRKLTLAKEDIEDALHQAAAASVQDLVLHLEHMDAHMFRMIWPPGLSLPGLQRVTVAGCQSVELGAALGQRCPDAALTFSHRVVSDIEADLLP